MSLSRVDQADQLLMDNKGINSDLETLLAASVELMKLRNENKLLLRLLAEANQKLEAYRGRGNTGQ